MASRHNVFQVIIEIPYIEGVKFSFSRNDRNLSKNFLKTSPLNSLHQTEFIGQ